MDFPQWLKINDLIRKGLSKGDKSVEKELEDLSQQLRQDFFYKLCESVCKDLFKKYYNLKDKDLEKKDLAERLGIDRTIDGKSLLYVASMLGNIDVVEILLELGAKIDTDFHPVFIAIEKNNNYIAELLIDRSDINFRLKDAPYQSFLEKAAEVGNYEICEYLIKEKKVDVNKVVEDSLTPLMWAFKGANEASVYTNYDWVITLLIENGAKLSTRNSLNQNVLLYVVDELNSSSLLNFLLRQYRCINKDQSIKIEEIKEALDLAIQKDKDKEVIGILEKYYEYYKNLNS